MRDNRLPSGTTVYQHTGADHDPGPRYHPGARLTLGPAGRQFRRGYASRPAGFTLMELLIVVLIIGVLISIIVPTVSKVREQAHAVTTQALIGNIGALMESYRGDHNAYPGPLSNMQIYATAGGSDPGNPPNPADPELVAAPGAVALDTQRITANENVVLGLFGGLRFVGGEIHYDTTWVGTGPGWLGNTPRKIPAYAEASDLSTRTIGTQFSGDYEDSNGESGLDSAVAELVDRFPEPMPLLILRARPGTRTAGTTAADNPIVTSGGPGRLGQYDLSQILSYTQGNPRAIGVGRKLGKSEYVATVVNQHGLQSVVPGSTTDPASTGYTYPLNAYAAFRNHAASGTAGGNDETPKQKDQFIIISAGIDRVYGTNDDITNFGGY